MTCVGESFTIVRLLVYMQLYAKQKQYYALYLDISCLISSQMETICRKSQIFISGKNMKMFRCVPYSMYFYVAVTSLNYEGSNSIYENGKDVNKIVINPKYSSKLGHIICLYII